MVKYRPQRGSLADAMKEVVEIETFDALVDLLKSDTADFPDGEKATSDNVEVKPYIFDHRIGWDTYIVTINGAGWGFTNGPLARHG